MDTNPHEAQRFVGRSMSISTRVARRLAAATVMIGATLGAAAAPAMAQDEAPAVSVDPLPGFAQSNRVTVTFTGLDDYAGGSVVVYLCGNADGGGNPIEVEAKDCIDPDTRGYVTEAISSSTVVLGYKIRYDNIGMNDRQCLPAIAGESACQIVAAVVKGGDYEKFGIPVDDFISLVPTDGTWGQTPSELPVTGLSAKTSGILAAAAAIALYLGFQLRRAAVPAPVRLD